MKIGSIPKQPMDPYLFDDLQTIADAEKKIKRLFAMMATPSEVTQSVFAEYPHLSIATDEGGLGITVEHFGTTIRFDCLLAWSRDNGAVGKVICTLQHQLWGSPEKQLLGTFMFNDRGLSDMPGDERGGMTSLPKDADRIVAYFLHEAHSANATIHLSKLTEPTD